MLSGVRKLFAADEPMNWMNNMENVYWHDAIIKRLELAFGEQSLTILLSAYRSKESESRTDVSVFCTGVQMANMLLDLPSIADNAISGNVVDCRVAPRSDDEQTVYLYLADGVIGITSSEIRVS